MVKDNLTIKPLDLSMKIMAPIDVGKIMVGAIYGVVFSFLPYSSTVVLGVVKAVSYQLHNYINSVCGEYSCCPVVDGIKVNKVF